MLTRALTFLLLAGMAFGQIPEDKLRSKIQGIHYSRLPEAARIQGDVHLKVSNGVVNLLSGPALLAQTAVEGTKSFAPLLGDGDFDVMYHFSFVNTIRLVPMVVKKGNAFERAVRHLFRLQTDEVVLVCDNGIAPLSELMVSGATIENLGARERHVCRDRIGHPYRRFFRAPAACALRFVEKNGSTFVSKRSFTRFPWFPS